MSASGTQNRMVPSQKNRGARLRARYPRQRSRPTNWQVGRSGSTHRRAARSGAVDRSRASRPAHGASASAQSPRVRLAAPRSRVRRSAHPRAATESRCARIFFILPPRGGSPRGAEASTMGGAFTPRTEAQKAAIPMPADATVALVAATCASISVAPFLMCVDRGVVAAAAGNAPGGSLFRAIGAVAASSSPNQRWPSANPRCGSSPPSTAARTSPKTSPTSSSNAAASPSPARLAPPSSARRQPPTWEEAS